MYIYNDEDNEPMSEVDRIMKYTVYSSRAEMKAAERGELDVRGNKPDNGCWNCLLYDPGYDCCTKHWNNGNPEYRIPDRDKKEPDNCCDDWEEDPDAYYDDFFGREGF